MKNVLLFAGDTPNAWGGWHDYRGQFDSVDEAKAAFGDGRVPADVNCWGEFYAWAHIVENGIMVAELDGDGQWSAPWQAALHTSG